MTTRILFGADHLAADPSLLGDVRRVALATNDAARSAGDARIRTRALLLDVGVPILRLFSPEHGLGAGAPDGQPVGDAADPLTGLPVTSLYGDRFAPPADVLAELDAVLFDIPDVGARCYTYTWTLTHLVDACAAAGVPVFVLDRPNPLGGRLESVEGPLLEPEHASFIGRHSLPVRHSLTLGELALLWQRERCPAADVRVIACSGWQRAELWPDTGLRFVPTSPAIASFEAALLYPGLVLFEATNLSVARGTPHAFRAFGAPWLDAEAVMAAFEARALPGLGARGLRFTPRTGPHAGQACAGVALRVVDPQAVRPVSAGIALLADVASHHREAFRWASYPTAANPGGAGHLERLIGSSQPRSLIDRAAAMGRPLSAGVIAGLTAAPGWAERLAAVRIYE